MKTCIFHSVYDTFFISSSLVSANFAWKHELVCMHCFEPNCVNYFPVRGCFPSIIEHESWHVLVPYLHTMVHGMCVSMIRFILSSNGYELTKEMPFLPEFLTQWVDQFSSNISSKLMCPTCCQWLHLQCTFYWHLPVYCTWLLSDNCSLYCSGYILLFFVTYAMTLCCYRRVARAALDDVISWLRNGGEVAVSSTTVIFCLFIGLKPGEFCTVKTVWQFMQWYLFDVIFRRFFWAFILWLVLNILWLTRYCKISLKAGLNDFFSFWHCETNY